MIGCGVILRGSAACLQGGWHLEGCIKTPLQVNPAEEDEREITAQQQSSVVFSTSISRGTVRRTRRLAVVVTRRQSLNSGEEELVNDMRRVIKWGVLGWEDLAVQ